MKKIISLYALIAFILTSCREKYNELAEIDKQLLNFLVQEAGFDATQKDRWGIILLQGNSCACKDYNHVFINDLIKKSSGNKFIVIAKNDFENRIKKNIDRNTANLSIYFEDKEQLLEKHGNVFAVDKVFVWEQERLTHAFYLDKEHYEAIEESLGLK